MNESHSNSSRFQRIWRTALDVTLSLTLIGTCAAIVWNITSQKAAVKSPPRARAERPADPPPPTIPVSLDGAAVKGSPTSKVAVIEYSDFQCPYCATFARDTLPDLQKAYVSTGKVRFAFRHLPLTIHQFAFKAAAAAECAAEQNKFWDMHDGLFANQKQLDDSGLLSRATNIGLDLGRFTSCLSGPVAAKVQRDIAEAQTLSINGTPTFLVGTVQADGRVKVLKRFSGAVPAAQFAATIDAVIAAATTEIAAASIKERR